jgi:hypothetical protein
MAGDNIGRSDSAACRLIGRGLVPINELYRALPRLRRELSARESEPAQ